MILESTLYYAKPGRAPEVLAMRRRGVALRLALGLAPGEIFLKMGAVGPDVRWECRFSDPAAFEADLAARDESPEFAEQRKAMGALLERFERHVDRLDEGAVSARTEIV